MRKKISILFTALGLVALSSCNSNSTTNTESTLTNSTPVTTTTTSQDQGTGGQQDTTGENNNQKSTTLWVIGDSTSCSFENDSADQKKYYPRVGYGTQLSNYFNDKVTVKNIAVSGRSSGSYFTEKTSKVKYEDFTSNIKEGDYVLLAFGHNDQNTDERYSNPTLTSTDTTTRTWNELEENKYEGGTVTREVSFKYLLTHYYIDVAENAKATPILATPIVRRNSNADTLTDANCHIWSGADGYVGGDYPTAIRELAEEKNLTLVDNTAITKQKYEAIGKNETLNMHAWQTSNSTTVDNTHLNIYGAKWVAYSVANSIKNSNCSLKDYLNDNLVEPTKQNDLVVNPNYVEASYIAPTTGMNIFTTTTPWMASAFGYLGSQPSTSYYTVTEGSGTVSLQAKSNKGKIANNSDGILIYYQQLNASSNFTLSATMKITQVDNNTQVGMGIMIRDDMYVDVSTANNPAIGSNYVAAGSQIVSASSSSATIKSTAKRENTTLTKGTNATVNLNETVNLSIVKNGNTYTVKFGNMDAVEYTLNLTEIDSDYVYAGVYVARNATVEFSNIIITN